MQIITYMVEVKEDMPKFKQELFDGSLIDFLGTFSDPPIIINTEEVSDRPSKIEKAKGIFISN